LLKYVGGSKLEEGDGWREWWWSASAN